MSMVMESKTTPFYESLQALFDKAPASAALAPFAKRAYEKFETIGLPTRKFEAYQYLPLRKLFDQTVSSPSEGIPSKKVTEEWAYDETKKRLIVFYNGHLVPELSNYEEIEKEVVIHSLTEGLGSYASFFKNRMEKWLKGEKDPFALLNGALSSSGIFIYVPPKTVFKKPIEILHLFDEGGDQAFMNPRTHIVLGQQAEATFSVRAVSLTSTPFFFNGLVDFSLDKGAQGKATFENWRLPESATYFNTIRASLKRDAKFQTLSFTDGSKAEREDFHVLLDGENGEANLYKAWMLADTRQSHSHILMEHKAPNCRSLQLFKGAVKDRSRSSFEGKVYVHPEAQKTDAYQLNNNLVLSRGAIADSKPNLEIFADDVKASHGSTVGSLDEEPLIYLQTRGLPKKQAQNILIDAFFKEVISLLPDNSLKELLEEHTLSYIKKSEQENG